MSARVAALFRHPVKGFTPEPIRRVALAQGEGFPDDRIFAVENGPSGFDPDRPTFIPKQKFTVLARMPRIAAIHTCYDAGRLTAAVEGWSAFFGDLRLEQGRNAFAAWLTAFLGDEAAGPLKVVTAAGAHRFTDHPGGQVSVVNLASVRDLGEKLGREIDPLRFRANIYVEGWPAWSENDWTGCQLKLGSISAEVLKPIVRCAATDVDPGAGRRDIDVTRALFDNYGHMHLGLYLQVKVSGAIALGDPCSQPTQRDVA